MRLLLAFTAAITIMAVMSGLLLAPSSTPYGPHNPSWNGYSTASSMCLKPVYSLPSGGANTLFVIPATGVSRAEATYLAGFVKGGGRLVILSNGYPASNELLSYMGINASFTNATIIDPAFNAMNQYLPIAVMLNNPVIAANASFIALNNATALRINSSFIPMAVTSPFSNSSLGPGPLPVAAGLPYGKGYVILISSPAIFMNSMIGEYGNARLLKSLCIGSTAFLAANLPSRSPPHLVRVAVYGLWSLLSAFPINYLASLAPLIIAILLNWVKSNRST